MDGVCTFTQFDDEDEYLVGIALGNIDRIRAHMQLPPCINQSHNQLCDAIVRYNNTPECKTGTNFEPMLAQLLADEKINIGDIFQFSVNDVCKDAYMLDLVMVDGTSHDIALHDFVTISNMENLLENYWLINKNTIKPREKIPVIHYTRVPYDPTQAINFLLISDGSCRLKYSE